MNVNDDWVKGIYDSCKGVHRLGSNVLNHYCKPYKAAECDHQKFLQYIGGDAEHYGHSPFEILPQVMFGQFVSKMFSSDKPHTGEGICPCIHCDGSCAPGETKIIKKEMPKFRGKKTKRATDSREMEGFKIYLDDIVHQFSDYETYAENEYCILDTTCKYYTNLNIRIFRVLRSEDQFH
ncbi:unnamed protein product [Oppiella nova]|uniref:Niemann-Pick C1 N-terminal domain-containing protein n=1 Tax=Oppiella nova TaxID=334625 RepID=A0A7R9LA27_9ACAR|nr:unnamed protein product [Oppiella nova]CAG2161216.1 unnamed protein product [Oppiella nova]